MSEIDVDSARASSADAGEPGPSGSSGLPSGEEQPYTARNRYTRFFDDPESLADFRQTYGIPNDVHIRLVEPDESPVSNESQIVLPLMAIIEGGVRFPFHPFLRRVLNLLRLTPSQVTINFYRIVMGALELRERYRLDFEAEDLFGLYFVSENRVSKRKFLGSRAGQRKLIRGLPDSDKYANEFVCVSGEFEYAVGEFKLNPIPRVAGYAGITRVRALHSCLFFSVLLLNTVLFV
jgi:hypothetical protein